MVTPYAEPMALMFLKVHLYIKNICYITMEIPLAHSDELILLNNARSKS